MLLSLSWLREFTPYEGTIEALGDRLTMLGLELEDIRHPFASLANITTGHVLTCEAHPNSDHLHCCRVDVGEEAPLEIVCGAPNVAQGQKVAVATIGTCLPDGLVIKKSKLRGQVSMGMICSERELGLSEDHSGIMVLPQETQVGKRLIDVLDLDRDILDLSITPNRGDCFSVLGLARECAMAFHLPLSIPERPFEAGERETVVPIQIDDPELCWLYSGRLVHNLTIKSSPMRIRHRLQACGIRAISNIVDVTNYILLEVGQPLHAFDYEVLEKKSIHVRRAHAHEHFTTLDGQERVLENGDLCICDGDTPVALAGVMGGLSSEITEKTTSCFLESAVFNPASIRKTSRRLGLQSESSFRFERGIDQARSVWALNRACAMMAELGGGDIDQCINVSEPRPFQPKAISFQKEHASALLGIEVDESFCRSVFQGLGCDIAEKNEAWEITQPSWRSDLTREADLIEEVGRVYGLDNIAPVLPAMHFSLEKSAQPKSTFAFLSMLRHTASGFGLNEAIAYSFVGQRELDLLNLPKEERIAIKNPLSSDQDVLRSHIVAGLLNALKNNLAQSAASIRLFELANVFRRDEESETKAHEEMRLGVLLCGQRHDTLWPYEGEDFDYMDLKAVVEKITISLHCPLLSYKRVEAHPYLFPCIEIFCEGKFLGVMGQIAPKIADVYFAQKPVWFADLDVALLRALYEKKSVQFTPLPIYPAVRRDVTVIGEKSLQVASVLSAIEALKNPLLEDVRLVSIYEPKESADKHLSFRLTFRHPRRTLKDSEIDKERERVAESLVKSLGVRL